MRSAKTKYLFAFSLAFFLLTPAFQNCSPISQQSQVTSADSSGGSGTGYEGKVFVSLVTGASCPDGSNIKAALRFNGTSAQLLRENCANLASPVNVQASVLPSGEVLYNGVSFSTQQPATYYVDSLSPTASDSAPGTSPDAPLKSLAAVNQRLWVPGDTISFKAGTSYLVSAAGSGALVITASGASSLPINFRMYGTGSPPEFSNPLGDAALLKGAANVEIDSLLFKSSAGAGVRVDSASSMIIVAGCEVSDVGQGIVFEGPNNSVQRVWIHDLKMIVNTQTPTNDDYGATAFVISSSGNEISGARVRGAKATCYDYGTCGAAFLLSGDVNGTKIHHNWVESSGPFLTSSATAKVSNLTVSMNISLGNTAFVDLPNSTASLVSARFENNTVFDPSTQTASGAMVNLQIPVDPAQLNFRNNIIVTTSRSSVYSQPGNYHSYNRYYGSGAVALGVGESSGDPLFVNTSVNDYHLASGSPAIGAGLQLGYVNNYDNVPIPGTPNLGAF